MYDEKKGYEDIKALSKEGRAVISHIVRNGICNIKSAHCMGLNVDEEIDALEHRINELGL